jgi:prenyl protein peptidase
VLPFYLSKTTRPSPTIHRDAPSVIRARIRAITLACIFCSLIVIYVITQYDHADVQETLHMLGWWPIELVAIGKTLLLCSILFAGPLFEGAIAEGRLGDWVRGVYIRETLASWTGWRNMVAGPVTEELVFRSLIIPLHLMAHIAPTRIVFVTPLYFGIAHIHHFYEFKLTHPEFPLLPSVLRTVFQFTYTSLFGFFAAFVFLRTGSVYAAIAAHCFCNWMGLPRFWGRVGVLEDDMPSEPEDTKKSDGASKATTSRPKKNDLSTIWTVVYYSFLFIGAYGFKRNLWSLTEGSGALAEFA